VAQHTPVNTLKEISLTDVSNQRRRKYATGNMKCCIRENNGKPLSGGSLKFKYKARRGGGNWPDDVDIRGE